MKRVWIVALLLPLTLAAQCEAPARTPTPARPTQTCEESDACWNCHTMGNRRCEGESHDDLVQRVSKA